MKDRIIFLEEVCIEFRDRRGTECERCLECFCRVEVLP